MSGTFTDDFGQTIVGVHPPDACIGEDCVIHNPSDHPLRHMPLRWREAGPFDIKPSHFERICEHGVGHPDPDSIEFFEAVGVTHMGVHGCDGCCSGSPPSGSGNKCQNCKTNDAEADHPCPYGEEINNDDTPCNCCSDCAQECAWDI